MLEDEFITILAGRYIKMSVDTRRREKRCVVCGSPQVSAIINGMPYCFNCGSKLIRLHIVNFLNALKREKLIPASVEIPEP